MTVSESDLSSPSISAEELCVLSDAIEIHECGHPLRQIPREYFSFEDPHPYEKVGAPYFGASPFALRSVVVERLILAQQTLTSHHPELRFHIWDGYRPLAVQTFMIEWTQRERARAKGLDFDRLSPLQKDDLRNEALQVWAPPNQDPLRPPPHSTGAAIDLTIKNIATGELLPMGSEIDAMPPECYPDFYSAKSDSRAKIIHENRELLRSVLEHHGFHRLPYEWWHFSFGDQRWAVLERRRGKPEAFAVFGRVDKETSSDGF